MDIFLREMGLDGHQCIYALHHNTDNFHMRLDKKGFGAVVWVGETAVKASSIHQGCSLGKLCKRLGEFVPAPEGFAPAPQPPKPVNTINRPEWEEYQQERAMPAPEAPTASAPRKRKRRPRATFKAWLRGRGLYRAASLWRYRQQIEPLPPIPFDASQPEQPEALPALRDAIARYFNALHAERVRVTCIRLRDDGTKQAMLLDKRNGTSIGFTQEELLARLPELLRLQARGENIYFTPLSETKHYILVDDVSRARASELLGDGYKPAVVLESSPGNYQCILTFPKARTPFDREIANRFTRVLNQKYGESNAFSVCFLQKQTIRRLRFAGKARFSRLLTARVSARAATGAVSL